MNTVLLIFGTIFFITLNGNCIENKLVFFSIFIYFSDAASLLKREQKFTLRGRVIFPNGSRLPIESDAKLTVELQDTSLADAPARVIAQGKGQAIRFPMAFAIKYTSRQVKEGFPYSLRVSIKNKNDELLYTNDKNIRVTPLGPNRTKFIDVPVILVKSK
jgi:putative lipoprotein